LDALLIVPKLELGNQLPNYDQHRARALNRLPIPESGLPIAES
jgi:hypothetical protein